VISDEQVKRLFQDTWRIQNKHFDFTKPLYTQLFRGVDSLSWDGQHPGGCKRHLSVFDRFNIVPKYCFECYKVLIEPRNVVELFKLMMVFAKLELPNDNTRKCMVENRKQVAGAYKGLVYCRSLGEGNKICGVLKDIVSTEISGNIPVSLKRGCSEYASSYPEYARINQDQSAMGYREEWLEYERLADREFPVDTVSRASHKQEPQTYSTEDAQAMLGWLKYAATIGDDSYLKICWKLQPFQNVERPEPYHPVEDD